MQLLEPVELVVFYDLDLIFLVAHTFRNATEVQRQVLRILRGRRWREEGGREEGKERDV